MPRTCLVLTQVSVDGAVLATKQMGDTLGEMALVSSQKRAADVLALSLCELAVLRRNDYLAVVSEKQNATLDLKRELIRANPLFGCLTALQRDELSKLGKLQRFANGETIIRQADSSDALFLIACGSVHVFRRIQIRQGRSAPTSPRAQHGAEPALVTTQHGAGTTLATAQHGAGTTLATAQHGAGTTLATASGRRAFYVGPRASEAADTPTTAPNVELLVNVLHKGQLFGEIGVMTGAKRSASVVAALPTELFVISRIELYRFLFDCPLLKQVLV